MEEEQVFRHFLENEKMCLCGETSNSFEVATKVGCAKNNLNILLKWS